MSGASSSEEGYMADASSGGSEGADERGDASQVCTDVLMTDARSQDTDAATISGVRTYSSAPTNSSEAAQTSQPHSQQIEDIAHEFMHQKSKETLTNAPGAVGAEGDEAHSAREGVRQDADVHMESAAASDLREVGHMHLAKGLPLPSTVELSSANGSLAHRPPGGLRMPPLSVGTCQRVRTDALQRSEALAQARDGTVGRGVQQRLVPVLSPVHFSRALPAAYSMAELTKKLAPLSRMFPADAGGYNYSSGRRQQHTEERERRQVEEEVSGLYRRMEDSTTGGKAQSGVQVQEQEQHEKHEHDQDAEAGLKRSGSDGAMISNEKGAPIIILPLQRTDGSVQLMTLDGTVLQTLPPGNALSAAAKHGSSTVAAASRDAGSAHQMPHSARRSSSSEPKIEGGFQRRPPLGVVPIGVHGQHLLPLISPQLGTTEPSAAHMAALMAAANTKSEDFFKLKKRAIGSGNLGTTATTTTSTTMANARDKAFGRRLGTSLSLPWAGTGADTRMRPSIDDRNTWEAVQGLLTLKNTDSPALHAFGREPVAGGRHGYGQVQQQYSHAQMPQAFLRPPPPLYGTAAAALKAEDLEHNTTATVSSARILPPSLLSMTGAMPGFLTAASSSRIAAPVESNGTVTASSLRMPPGVKFEELFGSRQNTTTGSSSPIKLPPLSGLPFAAGMMPAFGIGTKLSSAGPKLEVCDSTAIGSGNGFALPSLFGGELMIAGRRQMPPLLRSSAPFASSSSSASSAAGIAPNMLGRDLAARMQLPPAVDFDMNMASLLSAAGALDVEPPRKTRSKRRRQRCSLCEMAFSKRRELKMHMKQKHPEAAVLPKEGKIKSSRISKSGKERHLACHKCDMRFYQKSDLQRHLRVHDGMKPFKCSECSRRYTQRSSLYRHVRQTHPSVEVSQLSHALPSLSSLPSA